jgi:hypothetical protein
MLGQQHCLSLEQTTGMVPFMCLPCGTASIKNRCYRDGLLVQIQQLLSISCYDTYQDVKGTELHCCGGDRIDAHTAKRQDSCTGSISYARAWFMRMNHATLHSLVLHPDR